MGNSHIGYYKVPREKRKQDGCPCVGSYCQDACACRPNFSYPVTSPCDMGRCREIIDRINSNACSSYSGIDSSPKFGDIPTSDEIINANLREFRRELDTTTGGKLFARPSYRCVGRTCDMTSRPWGTRGGLGYSACPTFGGLPSSDDIISANLRNFRYLPETDSSFNSSPSENEAWIRPAMPEFDDPQPATTFKPQKNDDTTKPSAQALPFTSPKATPRPETTPAVVKPQATGPLKRDNDDSTEFRAYYFAPDPAPGNWDGDPDFLPYSSGPEPSPKNPVVLKSETGKPTTEKVQLYSANVSEPGRLNDVAKIQPASRELPGDNNLRNDIKPVKPQIAVGPQVKTGTSLTPKPARSSDPPKESAAYASPPGGPPAKKPPDEKPRAVVAPQPAAGLVRPQNESDPDKEFQVYHSSPGPADIDTQKYGDQEKLETDWTKPNMDDRQAEMVKPVAKIPPASAVIPQAQIEVFRAQLPEFPPLVDGKPQAAVVPFTKETRGNYGHPEVSKIVPNVDEKPSTSKRYSSTGESCPFDSGPVKEPSCPAPTTVEIPARNPGGLFLLKSEFDAFLKRYSDTLKTVRDANGQPNANPRPHSKPRPYIDVFPATDSPPRYSSCLVAPSPSQLKPVAKYPAVTSPPKIVPKCPLVMSPSRQTQSPTRACPRRPAGSK